MGDQLRLFLAALGEVFLALWRDPERAIAGAALFLAATTAIARSLDPVVPKLADLATKTATRLDDGAVRGLATFLVWLTMIGEIVRAFLPRASVTVAGRMETRPPSSRPPAPPAVLSTLVFAAVVGAIGLAGCGGAPRAVRSAIDVSAHALEDADAVVAPKYAEAAARALQDATSLDDYRARMHRWNAAEASLRTAASSLRAAELAADAWDSGEMSARGALACLAASVSLVLSTLTDLGIPPPAKLRDAVGDVRVFSGSCLNAEVVQ